MSKKKQRNKKPSQSFGNFDDFFKAQQGIEVNKDKKEERESSKKNIREKKNIQKKLDLEHFQNIGYSAKSPYNFVPTHNHKVEADTNPGTNPVFNKYHTENSIDKQKQESPKNTGYIELEIMTKTPIYIRDTLTEEEQEEQAKMEKNKERFINSDFFSPGNKIQLPGSSLRGLTRAMVEILSFGKFGFCDTKRSLYFRGLADQSNLRDTYQNKMSSYDKISRKSAYMMSAGILSKKGRTYYITPSEPCNFGDGFEPILRDSAKSQIKALGEKYENFRFYKTDKGYIIVSGRKIKEAKNPKDWLVKFPKKDAKPIEIPEQVIFSYQADINRDSRGDLLQHFAKNAKAEVPCFYVFNHKGQIGSFGHTAMFRLAYDKTIGEHIPINLDDNQDYIDIPEAIFGRETEFASRVFFENAQLQLKEGEKQEDFYMEEEIPKILSSPKPTTFQHYLVQKSSDKKKLSNYNHDTSIRGDKLFWHKSGNKWRENEISYHSEKFDELLKENKKTEKDFDKALTEKGDKKIVSLNQIPLDSLPSIKKMILSSLGKYESQHTKIKAIKDNTKFKTRIRFENLSDIELGALLFALDLPDGCYHKIGMAKPYGLGSIQIKPCLHLSDREVRYKSLFAEWEGIPVVDRMKDFKNTFANYIKEKINSNKELWQENRLEELQTMLHFETGIELEQKGLTRYMEIGGNNEFKFRNVLPCPSDVIGRKPKDFKKKMKKF